MRAMGRTLLPALGHHWPGCKDGQGQRVREGCFMPMAWVCWLTKPSVLQPAAWSSTDVDNVQISMDMDEWTPFISPPVRLY